MHNNYLCTTNFININELFYLFAVINIPEKVITSYYNTVIKKCRQLIFENSEVLASPYLEEMYGVNIIITEKFYETGKLQKYLSDHNLKAGLPRAVSKDIYEDCCMYTIIAKLAPKWNLVSNYFVKGRDFLTNNNINDCVRFNLCINDKGETSMTFDVRRIKLPLLSLDDFELSFKNITELEENKTISFQHKQKIIHVLPSMKRGNVLSMSLKPNNYWTLNDFHHFQRHWKNTYGYRLPKIEDDIFYLEISFFDGSPIFTYPNLCVIPHEPIFKHCLNPDPVITEFIASLVKFMPNVLGKKYPVPTHIGQPKIQLYPGTEEIQLTNTRPIDINSISQTQNSLTSTLTTLTQRNDNNENNQYLLKKPENRLPISTQNSSLVSDTPKCTFNKKENNKDKEIHEIKSAGKRSVISQEIQSQAKFISEKLKEKSDMSLEKIPEINQVTKKYAPVFKSSKPNISAKEVHKISESNEKLKTTKHIPIFTSKFPKIKTLKTIPASALKSSQKETKKQQTIDDYLDDFQIPPQKEIKAKSPPLFNSNKMINQNENSKESSKTIINPKRVLETKSESVVAKKLKKETMVTEINNMKELVNNGTINKLNVQSLLKWLKDRKVHCTTKEKKSVLIDKITQNLHKAKC